MYRYQGVFPTGTWNKEKVTQVFYIEPTTSNGSTFSVITAPTFSQYDNDIIFLAKFSATNSGTMSLNINGLGEKLIKKQDNGYLLDLLPGELSSNIIYNLSYDGNYFQISNSLSNAQNTQYYIPVGKTVIVAEYEEYWVYGDLTIAGTLINYGKVIVANGSVVLEGSGVLNEQSSGETILVTIKTPIFNDTDSIKWTSTITQYGASYSAVVVSPYKVYTALLTQSGTASPTAVVLENTIGNITWSRLDTGDYNATLNGSFTLNKTFTSITPVLNNDYNTINISSNDSIDSINIQVFNASIYPVDDVLCSTPIEIRVYN